MAFFIYLSTKTLSSLDLEPPGASSAMGVAGPHPKGVCRWLRSCLFIIIIIIIFFSSLFFNFPFSHFKIHLKIMNFV